MAYTAPDFMDDLVAAFDRLGLIPKSPEPIELPEDPEERAQACIQALHALHRRAPHLSPIRKRSRPITAQDVEAIESARIAVTGARDLLRNAGAFRSAARVRAAVKSCEGAANHARQMLGRQERHARGKP